MAEAPLAGQVVSREAELSALADWLADPTGPRAMLVLGEPGIGKTTLWAAAVVAARDRRIRLLSARASPAEVSLSFAGLCDLFETVEEAALSVLPSPQRRALGVALLREEPTHAPSEPRTITVGVLGLLRGLAAHGAVLVAIDDVAVLDAATAASAIAVRRVRVGPASGRPHRLETAEQDESVLARRMDIA